MPADIDDLLDKLRRKHADGDGLDWARRIVRNPQLYPFYYSQRLAREALGIDLDFELGNRAREPGDDDE